MLQQGVTSQVFLCVYSSTMAADFSQVLMCGKCVNFDTSTEPQYELILLFSERDNSLCGVAEDGFGVIQQLKD